MLYSGADLIRTSGQQAERIDRLKAADPVRAVASAAETNSSMDGDSQGALLRFARFVRDETKKPKPKASQKKTPTGLPQGYQVQIQLTEETQGPGAMLDLLA